MRNWEDQIEAALLAVIAQHPDIVSASITCRRWADASQQELYPVMLVHCSSATPAKESAVDELLSLIVDLGARTHRRDDRAGVQGRALAGLLRDVVLDSAFRTRLDSHLSGMRVISADLLSGPDDGDFDNINQSNITLNLTVQTI